MLTIEKIPDDDLQSLIGAIRDFLPVLSRCVNVWFSDDPVARPDTFGGAFERRQLVCEQVKKHLMVIERVRGACRDIDGFRLIDLPNLDDLLYEPQDRKREREVWDEIRSVVSAMLGEARLRIKHTEPADAELLTVGEQAVWDALEGRCLMAKELAASKLPGINTSEQVIRNRVASIKKKRGAGAIQNRAGDGYRRPDSPPKTGPA